MSPEENGEAMVGYARRCPAAARGIARGLKSEFADGTEAGYRAMGQEELRFFELAEPALTASSAAPTMPGR